MDSTDGQTLALLRRWNAGEQEALGELLEQHLPWVAEYVRRRLGEQARDHAETHDFVQMSMVDFLRYGPKFEVSDASAFRGLLARIAENNIRDEMRYHGRAKRGGGGHEGGQRGREVSSDSILDLDARRSVTRPSAQAQRDESAALVRVAIELLVPQDREVLRLREFQELSFAEVGARMEISEDAARMRFARALPRLAAKVSELRERGLSAAISPAD